MSQQSTEIEQPTVKRADALEAGDHVIEVAQYGQPPQPLKVLLAHPFRDGDGKPMVALMLDAPTEIDGFSPVDMRVPVDAKFEMADEQDLAAFHDADRRRALARSLHQLADDIVEQRLPLATYTVFFSAGVLESRADLDRWAAYLGAEVRGGRPGDPIPAVTVDRPVVERMGLNIHAQCPPEPEPKPEPLQLENAIAAAGALEAKPTGELAKCGCPFFYHPVGALTEVLHDTDCREWLFTFGSGQQHDGRFVRIRGTYQTARSRMVRVFGTAWCDQYDWRRFDELGLPAVLTELYESEWPAHAEATGRPALKHVSVLGNCISCGSRCPNGVCPNATAGE